MFTPEMEEFSFPGSVTPRDFGYSGIFEGMFLWLDVRIPSAEVKHISFRLHVADTINWPSLKALQAPSPFVLSCRWGGHLTLF